ncbi:hypothetical protein PGB90_009781 [Kerria lacca]
MQSSNFNFNEIYDIDKAAFKSEHLHLSSIKYPSQVIRQVSAMQIEASTSEKRKIDCVLSNNATLESNNVNTSKNSNSRILNNSTKENKSFIENNALEKISKINCKNSKRGISSFFQKQDTSNQDTADISVKITNVTYPNSKPEEEENTSISVGILTDEKILDINDNKNKILKTTKSMGKKNIAKTMTLKNTNIKSKIKKIKHNYLLDSLSETEDSDKNSDQSEEEPIYEQELDKKSEQILDISINQSVKKKRKIIEKNVFDEDGFLHTNKEVIYETCSSDNDENIAKTIEECDTYLKPHPAEFLITSNMKNEINTIKKGNIKNKNTKIKQSSIVNFFKKT